MKTLDRYILRTFLHSLLMWMLVIMALRIAVDLFLVMDEFVENFGAFSDGENAVWEVTKFIIQYYCNHGFIYFAEMGGVVIVVAAGFAIWQLSRTNELTAMLASGVSLYRVVFPIVIISIFMCSLVVIDREFIIPSIRHNLTRDPDELQKEDVFQIRSINDENNTVWFASQFYPDRQEMNGCLIDLRDERFRYIAHIGAQKAIPGTYSRTKGWFAEDGFILRAAGTRLWRTSQKTDRITTTIGPELMVSKRVDKDISLQKLKVLRVKYLAEKDPEFDMFIRADKFIPQVDDKRKVTGGELVEPRFEFHSGGKGDRSIGIIVADSAQWVGSANERDRHWKLINGRIFIHSNLTSEDFQLRQSGEWLDFCSSRELTRILKLDHAPDPGAVEFNKFRRLAEPFNNIIMLLIGLPFLLSRERSIIISCLIVLAIVLGFFAFIYVCPYLGLGSFFSAFLPTLIAGPLSMLMLDSIKT